MNNNKSSEPPFGLLLFTSLYIKSLPHLGFFTERHNEDHITISTHLFRSVNMYENILYFVLHRTFAILIVAVNILNIQGIS